MKFESHLPLLYLEDASSKSCSETVSGWNERLVKIQSLEPTSSFNTVSALRDLFEELYFLEKANRSLCPESLY